MLKARIDQLMSINAHLRSENAWLRLHSESVAGLGTGLQERGNDNEDIDDPSDISRGEPEDTDETITGISAANGDETVVTDLQTTRIKKTRRSVRAGINHRKHKFTTGGEVVRKITLLTIVSDHSTPNMNTVLKTADKKPTTSTSTPIFASRNPSTEGKEEPKSAAAPQEGKTVRHAIRKARKTNSSQTASS